MATYTLPKPSGEKTAKQAYLCVCVLHCQESLSFFLSVRLSLSVSHTYAHMHNHPLGPCEKHWPAIIRQPFAYQSKCANPKCVYLCVGVGVGGFLLLILLTVKLNF